jgi:hypothetical protein
MTSRRRLLTTALALVGSYAAFVVLLICLSHAGR